MQVTSTFTTGDLKPFISQEGERISLKWSKPSRVRDNVWFTGKYNHVRNIYAHRLSYQALGEVSEEDTKAIQKLMIKGKSDILTDGYSYYTFYGSWCKIIDLQSVLIKNEYIILER